MTNHQPPNLSPPRWLDKATWKAFAANDASRYRAPQAPCLVFSPLAWLKLQFFLHAGDTEIGGFGISDAHDLLYIDDFLTVKQGVSPASVEFDDQAVADFVDNCVDAGMKPQQFMRIWCHTHPGESPNPSGTDEETYSRVFGAFDWSVMFIIGRTGKTYARLSFSAGPAGNILLPVSVDWETWPTVAIKRIETLTGLAADWIAEYAANIHRQSIHRILITGDEPEWGEAFELLDPMGSDVPHPPVGLLEREQGVPA